MKKRKIHSFYADQHDKKKFSRIWKAINRISRSSFITKQMILQFLLLIVLKYFKIYSLIPFQREIKQIRRTVHITVMRLPGGDNVQCIKFMEKKESKRFWFLFFCFLFMSFFIKGDDNAIVFLTRWHRFQVPVINT
jgi:hypothetical protein